MRTALIRIRFPPEVVARLDELAARLSRELHRRVPRAAFVRALVFLQVGAFETDEIVVALDRDSVKRGRAKSPPVVKGVTRYNGLARFTVEIDRETDGRWIADVPELPGVMTYGATEAEAIAKCQALALRVIADRLEHGEEEPGKLVDVTFVMAA
jgi:predicted RNase H-like HicB family nuclease/predicted transcriptional regulator